MAGLIFDNSNSDISAESGLVTINGGPVPSTLDSLSDVVITGVGDNEVLAYNTGTGEWINQTADEAGLVDTTSAQSIGGDKTFTGRLATAASTVTESGLQIPHGAAPSAPVDGDIWTTTTGLFVRVNGVTAGPFNASTGLPAGSNTQVQYNNSGVFGATSNFTFNSSTNVVNVGASTTPGTFSVGSLDSMIVNGVGVPIPGFSLNSNIQGVIENHAYTAAGPTGGARYYGARTRGSISSPAIVVDGDNLATFYAIGYDGTDYATSSAIIMRVNGTPGSNAMPGSISFQTSPAGSQTLTERLLITSAGLVRIPDNGEFQAGTGGDLRLYHDGADSFITNNTGGMGITTNNGNLNVAATVGSVNIDAGNLVDIDAVNGLFVDNNIEINGAGWAIFPNRVGAGTVPNVAEAAGAVLQVVGNSYVDGDHSITGGFGLINGAGTVENVISASGTPDQFARIRNFSADATLWEVRSRAGTVGTADREATLALTRTDDVGNEEFLDLFNNGYASLAEKISEAYGIRIQKRGTGVYRPFYFDWYDGTTVTDGLDVLSPDDSGGPLFRFQQRLTTVATSASRAGLNVPHGTAPSSPVDGDVWTTTSGVFVRINGATVGPLIDAATLGNTLQTSTTVVNFNTSSPVTLFTTPTNCMVKEVTVIIDTAFNDAAATLSVGVNGGSNSKYMTTGGNQLDAVATSVFTVVNGNPAASAEALEAYLIPGTATQGSVRVVVVYYVES